MTPREGPMACCPRGHLICSPCLRGIQVRRFAQNCLSSLIGLYLSLIQGDLIQAQLDPGVSINAGLVQAREVVECPTCRWLVGELC